jgi:cytochrome P450 family 142 subfamily A polypeptide 1
LTRAAVEHFRGTRPDVDLTDGRFYADRHARAAHEWMRANEPVFRDRNGLAAATTYQAVLDAERDPQLFCNSGGIRPDQPGLPFMIDMDDPEHLHVGTQSNLGGLAI